MEVPRQTIWPRPWQQCHGTCTPVINLLFLYAYFSPLNLNLTLVTGLGVAFLKFIASPMCRSILAANVAPNEIGKIYALTSAIESMSALVASPLYSFVYQSTLSFYPGAFNMISAGVYGACICAMT